MSLEHNPFTEMRHTAAFPGIVTRLAAIIIAGKTYEDAERLCRCLDASQGKSVYSKLLYGQPFLNDYDTDWRYAYNSLRQYAVNYVERHAAVIA